MNHHMCDARRETNVEAKNLLPGTSVEYKGVGKARDGESDVSKESNKSKGVAEVRDGESNVSREA